MNKHQPIRIVFVLALIFVLVSGADVGAQSTSQGSSPAFSETRWLVETVASTQCFFANVSLALGPGDVPHISYNHPGDDTLKYASRSGSGWNSQVVDDAAAVASSIALDSSGHPHIAYRDGASNSLKYASWDGAQWAVETVGPNDEGWYASLQFDSENTPHIAYLGIEENPDPALGGAQRPKYAHLDGDTWDISLIQGLGSAGTMSMALDSLDRPHVAYDWYSTVVHAVYSDTAWITQTVDSDAISGFATGQDVSIDIDNADTPHISYALWGSEWTTIVPKGLKYAHQEGANWARETVSGPAPLGFFNALALDSNGHPHIVYFDQDSQTLKYARRDNQEWTIADIELPVTIQGGTSIALDSSGQPHVAFCDAKSDKVKYAHQVVRDNQMYLPVVSSTQETVTPGEIAYLVAPGDGSFYHLYTMNADGSNQRKISALTAVAGYPVWSPDGKRIAFDSLESPSYDIYVMDADGSNQINATQSAAVEAMPTWSPDGSKIAFSSNRDTGDNRHDIFVMNADGSNVVRLTDTANDLWWDNYLPAWSPDGAHIAVEAYTSEVQHAIYVMNADGTNKVKVTNDAYSFPEDEPNTVLWIGAPPAWSPDSTRIVFVSDGDGNDEIYVVNADGTNLMNLTNRPSLEKRPVWSPDGSKIAFISDVDTSSGGSDIYVMNADGSNVVRLTTHPAIDSFPTWSPDGARIAFASDRDGIRAIYVMNADGSDQVKISDTPLWATLPVWSP